MPQNITRSILDLVAEADAVVETMTIAEALSKQDGEDIQLIDIRDIREVAKTGRISGARHVPRGMLEFWIDPESPYHKPFFAADKTFVFYCAGAWRSALAAKTAQDMGLAPVAHLEGGITAWIEADGPIDPPREAK